MTARSLILAALLAALASCRATHAPAPPAARFTTLAPGLRADPIEGVVEFDAFVAEDVHHPDTPRVYLEVLVCARGTREHESLAVTDVPPSLVHAALLAAGLEPGAPGGVSLTATGSARRTPPTGSPVHISFTISATDRPIDPRAWAIHADTGAPLADHDASFVFAGSVTRERNGRTWYAADAEGTLVGLATFGTETIALTDAISHESAIDEPAWIADASRVPPKGTPITVRLERAE